MAAHTREVAAAVYPDPQRLYEKDEFHRKSPLGYWTGALSGFAFGCSSHLYNNLVYNRPYWAGLLDEYHRERYDILKYWNFR